MIMSLDSVLGKSGDVTRLYAADQVDPGAV
jgi:hypothetical protein